MHVRHLKVYSFRLFTCVLFSTRYGHCPVHSPVSACMGLAKMYRQNLLNRSVVSYARQPIKEQIALYTVHFAQQTFL